MTRIQRLLIQRLHEERGWLAIRGVAELEREQ